MALCTAALTLLSATTAVAAPDPAPNVEAERPKPTDPSSVTPQRRAEVLGGDWQRSDDRMWTTTGDQTGFHVMVASAKSGYAWKTVATLNHPAVEADLWIGNACATGSGDRIVVVYAPRTYTNKEDLMARGAFTATVDLNTGAVKKLPVRTTLAYYNPGCGLDETAVLTQDATEDKGKTGLIKLDAATGVLSKRVEVLGQVTSAVPARDGVIASSGSSLERIADDGKRTRLASTTGVAFELKPDAANGVVYLEGDDRTNRVQRLDLATAKQAAVPSTLAAGKAGDVGLARTIGGKVVITGKTDKVEKLPATVSRLDVPAGVQLSSRGESSITEVARADGKTPGVFSLTPGKAERVHIKAKSTKTGKDIGFTVDPAADRPVVNALSEPGPSGQSEMGTLANQDMSEAAATCAIRRNDLSKQIYQPKPKQVEWAANWAVNGGLMWERPPNWHNNGLSFPYKQQEGGMFPSIPLRGGGKVPVQVMLGILGQESNLWQASRLALPGEWANSLIGNYYGNDIYNGTEADDWDIDFSKADCGYGVSQTTDGMRLAGRERPGETARSYAHQVMIATDYAANVAAGLQILQEKWNQLQDAGVTINNNDPGKLENWFGAVWAYNSGYHPAGEGGSNGAVGLGWGNNPANARYPANRYEFGRSPADFATPQKWPYPEKVMGFAANPPSAFEDENTEVRFFNAAWWNGDEKLPDTDPKSSKYNRKTVKPPINTFCTPARNDCYPGVQFTPNAPEVVGEPAGPCAHKNSAGQYDLKCWWNNQAVWKADCDYTCGNENYRYYPDYPREPDDALGMPTCGNAKLVADAMVVDDLDRATPPPFQYGNPPARTCPRTNFVDGTFSIDFATPSSRMDLHHATSGYGGHYWFSHAHADDEVGRKLRMTATWTLGRTVNAPVKVLAFQPPRALNSSQLTYSVHSADGVQQVNVSPGTKDEPWVELGVFSFTENPKVSLSSINAAGNEQAVAFDAVAFVPAGDVWQGDQIVKLVNENSGRCLNIGTPNPHGQVLAEQRACSDDLKENWVFHLVRTGTTTGPSGPVKTYDYTIKNRVTGQCLVGGEPLDGVIMGDCSTATGNLTSKLWRAYGFQYEGSFKTTLEWRKNYQYTLAVYQCDKEDGGFVTTEKFWGESAQRGCPTGVWGWDWNVVRLNR
ncbi:hypothetical protein [Lentzea sp. HUAS12]|uniref:golvesin C-terminal-like domain-containing protein n=1 Tax=Lentzea sp. HUAS12 TaxID=2951806 RepID=UPI0020A19EA6|nr:hypothetical protein [Lentzea sp. HUAS12]USX50164.1 hypothetical protein ND450_32945 [Lentzea sp. HUAS12]